MVEEAVRVAQEAERNDVALRLLGGVAIKVRAHDGLEPAFEREYADLDWITQKGKSTRCSGSSSPWDTFRRHVSTRCTAGSGCFTSTRSTTGRSTSLSATSGCATRSPSETV